MKITVLVDNNTLIDRYLFAEPGLSLLLEDEETKVLFDTGFSGIFLTNALKLGISLTDLDYLVLSHKHLDHTWGLVSLIEHLTGMDIDEQGLNYPSVVAHPDVFTSVSGGEFRELGCLLSEAKLARHFPLQLSTKPQKLSSRLTFLGEIPRRNDFEAGLSFGYRQGSNEADPVVDDSALVYQTKKGLVIITGCSHSGICNIVAYAKRLCGDERVLDIIGGLHLQDPTETQLKKTVDYLKQIQPERLHACHCTDLKSKIALSRVAPLEEVGAGYSVSYEVA